MVFEITTEEQFDEIVNRGQVGGKDHGCKHVLVDFWATWCGPCVRFSPELDKLAEQYPNVFFAKVNIETLEDLTTKMGIRALPTFMFFDVGNTKSEYEPVIGADKLKLMQRLDYFNTKSKPASNNAETFDF